MSKRPRLFAFSREIELATVEGWARPEERDLLERLVDGFIEVTRTRKLTPDRLAPAVEASRHPSANVRALGIARLLVMAHYFEHARSAFRELSLCEDPAVRETACTFLPNAPEELLLPLLEVYLADEEAPVRRAAARVGANHRLDELKPLLERALARETDAHTLKLLGRAHTFQTD